MPWSAGQHQRTETRRAFYAGAGALLGTLSNVLGPDKEPTESDLLIMQGVANELAEFRRDVQGGLA